ncbi:MAG: metallophosphatase family protein [Chloroflexi bacterium]|nr:metallophosphatase family protein [Chloroflexota bacterium]
MPATSKNTNLSWKEKSTMRIGLISDTHESENPAELIARLGAQQCDLYIHLGDIGGSRLASKFVRQFKQTLGNVDHLSEDNRRRFEELKRQGLTPMWAYIETNLGADPASRLRREKEARDSYLEVFRAMSRLPNAIMVSGNIDNSLLRSHIIGAEIKLQELPLVVEPKLLDLGFRAIILWPSMKNCSGEALAHLNEQVDAFVRAVADKEQILVFAHEQIYKGPSPSKYRENVESAGYCAMTVPRYEPNPRWPLLLRLFRSLKPTQQAAMVYGHVHDPHHVIQAGAPYLKGSLPEGLRYRLYGLGSPEKACIPYSGGRQSIRLYTIPTDAVAILNLTRKRMKLEIVQSE